MRRKSLIIVLGCVLLAVGLILTLVLRRNSPADIDETKNLITNGGFENVSDGVLPDGWSRGMWYWDSGVSYLYASDEACSGSWSICVENVNENDARFEQTVSVEPDSWYRISCMARAEGCDPLKKGAGLSVENTFVSTDYLYDTQGEWTRLTMYGLTGSDQKSITVMCRVGYYGSENVGKAWFDDVEVVRVKNPPEGVLGVSLATTSPSSGGSDELDTSDRAGLVMAIAVLTMLVGIWLILFVRGRALDSWATAILLSALAAGLVIRVILAVTVRGFNVDISCFESWSDRMSQYKPWGFYGAGWCDYPPGYMLLLWPVGALRNALHVGMDTPGHWLLVKTIPIFCDLLTGLFIVHVAKKKLPLGTAAIMGTVYILNPLVIFNSACWGQVDTVLTLLLACAVYLTVQKRWRWSLTVFGVAALMKPQALMFAPFGVIVLICDVIRAKERRANLIKQIGLALLVALTVFFGLALPFSIGQGRAPFGWLLERYSASLGEYNYVTVNGCNLYEMLGLNWKPLENSGFWAVLGWLTYPVAFLLTGALLFKSGERRRIFLLCATALCLIFAFGAKMHERYIYPAVALLLLAYTDDRDIRILGAAALLSASAFLNVALVYEDNYLFNHTAMAFFCAALNTLAAVGLVYTSVDICVRKHVIAVHDEPVIQMSAPAAAAGGAGARRALSRVGRLEREDASLHMRPRDWAIMLGVTAAYSVLAFYNLGSMKAPQTAWTSSQSGENLTFELQQVSDFHVMYYGGICNSTFTLAFSDDGQTWSEEELALYNQGEIFRWIQFAPQALDANDKMYAVSGENVVRSGRYVRLTAEKAGLVLHEIAFIGTDGKCLTVDSVKSAGAVSGHAADGRLLVDEQDTVPDSPGYYNSTYFDEIYHARTGYEFLHSLNPYETTHPPLGKVFIMWGIELFGMTPFGWRFMGTLFGVLMLPVMYLLCKQLFKKTEYAAIGMLLMTFDFMHFTQSRIATIDTYGVFFIMLMYLFMFRYCQMSFYYDDLGKTFIPLGLCGISMGLGVASKWIGVYAGFGLAVLFFYTMARRYLEHRTAVRQGDMTPAGQCAQRTFTSNLLLTGLFCVVFFVIVPCVIYGASYYWYLRPRGGITLQRLLDSQSLMFNYHKNLTTDTHFFRSPWYEWPLIIKPMWYYSGSGYVPADYVSSIYAMGNPAVWWTGLGALVYVIFKLCAGKGRRTDLYIVLGFLAQYLPWVLVPRSTFIYHYFASVPFIILATVMLLRDISIRYRRLGKGLSLGLIALSVILFAAFYPLLSGMPALRSYLKYLHWFNWFYY